MKFEYLLFNLIVTVGPVVSQFNRQIKHISQWRLKLLTNGIVMIPYIIWDVLVTGSHWHFNKAYTLDFRLFGLPIGEWLFFITVPFGCLLVWETLSDAKLSTRLRPLRYVGTVLYIALPIGIWVFSRGKQYTGLVLCCIGLVGLTDTLLRTELLMQLKTYIYLGIVVGLILIFNGYLTARPVVLYGEAYQMGYRILTIPIEDFGYGFTLMLFNAMFYEKVFNFTLRRNNGRMA
ncbi:lycopene cyclase domain-containing protein [Candidatus Poribacteria bacterium]|nr:lycopene cyclase domain-containing protein [Candidatus Poribacteria bacterium]MYA56330.1 lycopene cyclase domain-containing protein [Candidatus Poribacteria bacterium]